jgi:hypothetical protein
MNIENKELQIIIEEAFESGYYLSSGKQASDKEIKVYSNDAMYQFLKFRIKFWDFKKRAIHFIGSLIVGCIILGVWYLIEQLFN